LLLRVLITILRYAARMRTVRAYHPRNVKSVLVVELARLGDVVSIIPSLRLLVGYFPYAKISIIVDAKYATLLRAIDLDVDVYGVSCSVSLLGFLQGIMVARRLRADLACSMSHPRRNVATVLSSGAPLKVGYLTYVDSYTPYLRVTQIESFGFELKKHVTYGKESIEERSLKVCESLGVERDGGTRVVLKNEVYESARSRLCQQGSLPSNPYTAVHPFSGWEFRTWDLGNFTEFVEEFVKTNEGDVIFLCAEDEFHKLKKAREKFNGSNRVSFFSSNDLVDTAVVLRDASLFVGNDSGPLHLAAALGTKVVGLFGPVSPSVLAPTDNGTYLYHKVECSPCDQRTCIRPENNCMNLIGVQETLTSVERILTGESN